MTRDDPSPPRPVGRPRVPDPTTPVTTCLPTRMVDRIARTAQQKDESISRTIRRVLERHADEL